MMKVSVVVCEFASQVVVSLRRRFPFPFTQDEYHYSNNLRPLQPPVTIAVTAEYEPEIAYKRRLLRDHPERCFQSDPRTREAQWEVLDHVVHELAEVYPQYFQLHKTGESWTFCNMLLQEDTVFTPYDCGSLGLEPLDFVGRHVQEDLLLLMQSDGELTLEAGQLCFPGNWSLAFDVGMPFLNIHRPVPGLVTGGLAERIQRFLLHIETGKPWTRLNWSLNAGHRLDTSPETYTEWGPQRYNVQVDTVGSVVHLRVEEQNVVRLPRTNALLFTIHTYLMPMEELVQNPQWSQRIYSVLKALSPDLRDYKGITPFYEDLMVYLHEEVARGEG